MRWMPSLLICKVLAIQGVDVDMDINILSGAILIVLMISFVGLWAWTWSQKRKPAFHEASMLPLEEDEGIIPSNDGPTDGKGE